MIEEFKAFMIFNGWWDIYLEEFFNSIMRSSIRNIDDYLKTSLCTDFIRDSFSWGQSKQGFVFWYDIDYDWMSYIEYWKEELGECYGN